MNVSATSASDYVTADTLFRSVSDEANVIKDIIVVGGGTAGWLTACILAKALYKHCEQGRDTGNTTHGANSGSAAMQVHLLESDQIATVGVGEGTWPTMRQTLHSIGISETDLVQKCYATFKQGSQFNGWVRGDDNSFGNVNKADSYLHPFTAPIAHGKFDLAAYWQAEPSERFADAVSHQSALCHQSLAAKSATDKEYQGLANYGYHLDAGKLAELLQQHAVQKLGVKHIVATLDKAVLNSQGEIDHLLCDAGQVVRGDFFDASVYFQDSAGAHSDQSAQARLAIFQAGLRPVRYRFFGMGYWQMCS